MALRSPVAVAVCASVVFLSATLSSGAVINFHVWQPFCEPEGAVCGWQGGTQMQHAANVMAERINASGFLKKGHTLRLIPFDTHCSPQWGLKTASQLIMKKPDDWPFAVIGCGCSGCSLNAAPILYTAKIPMVSQSSSAAALSDRVKYPAFFRFWPSDEAAVDANFKLFGYFGFKTFAMVYDEQFGEGLVPHYKYRLASYAGEFTDVLAGWPGQKLYKPVLDQALPILLKVVSTNVRAMMSLLYETGFRAWCCAAFRSGISGMVAVTFGWYTAGWETMDYAGCKASEWNQANEYTLLPTSTAWAPDNTQAPCSSVGDTVGKFRSEVEKRLTASGVAASGGEGYTGDTVCFLATALNAVLDAGYTPEELTNANATTFTAIATAMQAATFAGVSGHVGFPADVAPFTKQKAGDRSGSYLLKQHVQGSFVEWGFFAAGTVTLLAGKQPMFGQGFSWPTNPPTMMFPSCPTGEIYAHKENKCKGCPTNKVFAQAVSTCVCIAGFFESNATCHQCAAGTFSASVGALECKQCDTGKYAGVGATKCDFCGRGTYAASKGSAQCTACLVGKTTRNIASEKVTDCLCNLGYYGNSVCASCPLNSTTLSIAATDVSSCMCSQNFYMNAAMTSCLACPSGSASDGTGKTDISGCLCKLGTYLEVGAMDSCTPCIEGMTCPIGSSAAHFPHMVASPTESTYPRLKLRQWASKAEPMSVFTCRTEYQCPGGAPEACGPSLSGMLCSDCPQEWHWTGTECLPCSSSEASGFIFPALPIILFPLVILWLYRISGDPVAMWGSWKNGIAAFLFSCLNHYQIIVLLQSSTIDFPAAIGDTYEFWSFSEDPFTIFKMDCAGYSTFESAMIFKATGPVILWAMAFALWLGSIILARATGKAYGLNGDCMFNVIMSMMFTFFGAIASMAVSLFKCMENPNGKATLASDLRVVCHDSSQWQGMLVLGVISFLVYVVAIGSLWVFIVITAPKRFESPTFQRRWKFLLIRWRPDVWWWSVAFLLKNLLYNLAFVIFTGPLSQFYAVAIITFAYLGAVVAFYPFRHRAVNMVEIFSCASLILNASILGCVAVEQGDPVTQGLAIFAVFLSFTPLGSMIGCVTYMVAKVGLSYHKGIDQDAVVLDDSIYKSAQIITKMGEADFSDLLRSMGEWDRWFLTTASNIIHVEAGHGGQQRITEKSILVRENSKSSNAEPSSDKSGEQIGAPPPQPVVVKEMESKAESMPEPVPEESKPHVFYKNISILEAHSVPTLTSPRTPRESPTTPRDEQI